MRIDVLSIFPHLVLAPLSDSIVLRARNSGALTVAAHDLRTWTDDVHRTVDDTPYGGGAGMVMRADPIVRGAEALATIYGPPQRCLIMAANGASFDQQMAVELASVDHVLIVCGHYEGIDARVTELLDAQDVSIGNYVLTGGELPAAVIIDTIARLLPGVINPESLAAESHSESALEYPHFTRPAEYRGLRVPDVLLGGNHAEIDKWRQAQSRQRTSERRPDLFQDRSSANPGQDVSQT